MLNKKTSRKPKLGRRGRQAINPICEVASNTLEQFDDVLHPQAARIITPFPDHVPLEDCKLSKDVAQFIKMYEPAVRNEGLYSHQAEFLEAFEARPDGDFITTTATASGKSLCFWVWVFECLRRDLSATALLCFPNQALMWGQAERLAQLSDPDRPNSSATPRFLPTLRTTFVPARRWPQVIRDRDRCPKPGRRDK